MRRDVTKRTRAKRIFVSYSRRDSGIVRKLVELLRATEAEVFLDSDSIRAGAKWRSAIKRAVKGSHVVMVFWCRHSSASPEVAREYEMALEWSKAIIPVLLDSTRRPSALAVFQWVDFRKVSRHPKGEKKSRMGAGAKGAPGHGTPTAGVIISKHGKFGVVWPDSTRGEITRASRLQKMKERLARRIRSELGEQAAAN
jgi:hypothetical protein